MNSFDIQNEGEALLERHRKDVSSKTTTASSISTQRSRLVFRNSILSNL
jgi:hypothetical protein